MIENIDKLIIAICSGYLGDKLSAAQELVEGAAASFRNGPQSKTLGENLRMKVTEVPESVLSGQ